MSAQKNGLPTWNLNTQPPEDDGDAIMQAAMEKAVGPALMQLSKWVGERAGANDKKAIFNLVLHFVAILETGQQIIEANEAAQKN